MQKNNYVLIGFMGSGKTTVGKILAQKTGMIFRDLDALLVENAGMSVKEIFKKETEKGFRDRETALIRRLVQEGAAGMVYSCGGGAPLREENRKLLKDLGRVIWLDVKAETVIERLSEDRDRPLLQRADRECAVKAMLLERRGIYQETADTVIATDEITASRAAEEIIRSSPQFIEKETWQKHD